MDYIGLIDDYTSIIASVYISGQILSFTAEQYGKFASTIGYLENHRYIKDLKIDNGHLYLMEDSFPYFKQNLFQHHPNEIPPLVKLVYQIDELKSLLTPDSASYLPNLLIIYDKEDFIRWKEALYHELSLLKRDNIIERILSLLDQFNGYNDENSFAALEALINIMRKDIRKYLSSENNEANIESCSDTPKTIFISHRSTDQKFCTMLIEFLILVGVPRNSIFCSSLPGNDVHERISSEVRNALKNSSLNIALLSTEYYKSAYCMNEAGIIWYNDTTPAILISLPEINEKNMYGFLDPDYKIRRLDNMQDITYIYDTVKQIFSLRDMLLQSLMGEVYKLQGKYSAALSYVNKQQVNIPPTKLSMENSNSQLTPLGRFTELLSAPDDWVDEADKYYHSQYPELTIQIAYDEDRNGLPEEGNKEFYHHVQTDTTAYYGTIKLFQNSTQLFSWQISATDGFRMIVPCPEWGFLDYEHENGTKVSFKYYIASSIPYLLLNFLEKKLNDSNGGEASYATQNLLEVVLIFDSEEDLDDFKAYVSTHIARFNQILSRQHEFHVEEDNSLAEQKITQQLRDAQTLKEMQEIWGNTKHTVHNT